MFVCLCRECSQMKGTDLTVCLSLRLYVGGGGVSVALTVTIALHMTTTIVLTVLFVVFMPNTLYVRVCCVLENVHVLINSTIFVHIARTSDVLALRSNRIRTSREHINPQ